MTRDDLIKAITGASGPKPIRIEAESVGLVYVRMMTAFDADQTKKVLEETKKDDGCGIGRLLSVILCDDKGELLFDVKNPEHVLMLSKLPPKTQNAIISAANQANEPGK